MYEDDEVEGVAIIRHWKLGRRRKGFDRTPLRVDDRSTSCSYVLQGKGLPEHVQNDHHHRHLRPLLQRRQRYVGATGN
jgi:hypothetical protein